MAQHSDEIRATTFVVDGMPMSFDEMKAYRAEKARIEEAARIAHEQMIAEEQALQQSPAEIARKEQEQLAKQQQSQTNETDGA